VRRSIPKSATPKSVTKRSARTSSRSGRPSARVRASEPAVRAGAGPASSAAPEQSAPLATAMARTVADAEHVGRELGSAGVSIARGALKLVYDVGAVLGLAARGLVSATLDAADAVAPRPLTTAAAASSARPMLRKPPVAVAGARREGRGTRRLAG
jgi:hypothetical protein